MPFYGGSPGWCALWQWPGAAGQQHSALLRGRGGQWLDHVPFGSDRDLCSRARGIGAGARLGGHRTHGGVPRGAPTAVCSALPARAHMWGGCPPVQQRRSTVPQGLCVAEAPRHEGGAGAEWRVEAANDRWTM